MSDHPTIAAPEGLRKAGRRPMVETPLRGGPARTSAGASCRNAGYSLRPMSSPAARNSSCDTSCLRSLLSSRRGSSGCQKPPQRRAGLPQLLPGPTSPGYGMSKERVADSHRRSHVGQRAYPAGRSAPASVGSLRARAISESFAKRSSRSRATSARSSSSSGRSASSSRASRRSVLSARCG